MQLPESFYIALCGTILLLGVIYWFWTQTQYIQRKVSLLENVVYEMKTLVSNLPGHFAQTQQESEQRGSPIQIEQSENAEEQKPYAPPPESVAGDLEEERNNSEQEFSNFAGTANEEEQQIDELTPGGLAFPDEKATQDSSSGDKSLESPLQTLTTKELRRMAEANGIPGASELKKRDLVKALRNTVSSIIQNSEQPTNIMSFEEISAPLTE